MKFQLLLLTAFSIHSLKAQALLGEDCSNRPCEPKYGCHSINRLCILICETGHTPDSCNHVPNSVCRIDIQGNPNPSPNTLKMCTIINLSQTNLCNDKIKCPSGQTCDEMTLTCYNTPNSGPPPVNGPPGKLGQVCPAEGDKCEGGAVCSKKKYCVTPCTKDSDCGSTASAGDCTLLANGNGLKGCINQNINNLCKGNPPKCPFGNTCNLYTMSCQRSKNIGQECSQTSDCLSRLVCNPTITDGTKSVCTAACDNDSECTLGNGTPKKCSKSSSPESLATGYCEINARMQCHKNNECSKRCNIHILQCNN